MDAARTIDRPAFRRPSSYGPAAHGMGTPLPTSLGVRESASALDLMGLVAGSALLAALLGIPLVLVAFGLVLAAPGLCALATCVLLLHVRAAAHMLAPVGGRERRRARPPVPSAGSADKRIALTVADAPRLIAEINDLATRFDLPPFDQVLVSAHANASVRLMPPGSLRGRGRGSGRGRGARHAPETHPQAKGGTLTIGLPLILELSRPALRAVIAHECAHLARHDEQSAHDEAQAFLRHRRFAAGAQSHLFVGRALTLRWLTHHERRLNARQRHAVFAREIDADRAAAAIVGKAAMREALHRVAMLTDTLAADAPKEPSRPPSMHPQMKARLRALAVAEGLPERTAGSAANPSGNAHGTRPPCGPLLTAKTCAALRASLAAPADCAGHRRQ